MVIVKDSLKEEAQQTRPPALHALFRRGGGSFFEKGTWLGLFKDRFVQGEAAVPM